MNKLATDINAALDANPDAPWRDIVVTLLARAGIEGSRRQRYVGGAHDARTVAKHLAKLADVLDPLPDAELQRRAIVALNADPSPAAARAAVLVNKDTRPPIGAVVFVPVCDDPCLIFDGSPRPFAFVACTVTEHADDGTFSAEHAPDTEPFGYLIGAVVKRALEPTDRLVKSEEDDDGNFTLVTVVR